LFRILFRITLWLVVQSQFTSYVLQYLMAVGLSGEFYRYDEMVNVLTVKKGKSLIKQKPYTGGRLRLIAQANRQAHQTALEKYNF